MIAVAEFGLLRPFWLLALPLVLAAGLIARHRVAALGGWRTAIEPHLIRALEARGRIVPGGAKRSLALTLTAALLTVALLGPAFEREGRQSLRNLDGTVVVMDLSQSVTTGERFGEALAATQGALSAAGTRQTALVVFAGDAYLASPFTSDHAALARLIFGLDAKTVPLQGSRPMSGLAMAFDLLKEAGVVSGDIAFVSDGGGLDAGAQALAARIAEAGYRIDTLYVEPVKGRPGNPGALAALAYATSGASADALDPGAITAALADAPANRLGQSDFRALAWADLGPFLLVLAMVPALFLFRRSV